MRLVVLFTFLQKQASNFKKIEETTGT